MEIDDVVGLFEGDRIERINALVVRRKQLGQEIGKLTSELTETDAELRRLIAGKPAGTNGGTGPQRKRRCNLCNSPDHITSRKRTADGRQTCPTHPDGKAAIDPHRVERPLQRQHELT